MTVRLVKADGRSDLHLENSLTFNDSKEYRTMLAEALKDAVELHIHLQKLNFMDSSGLGMLIVSANEAEEKNVPLTLHQPQGDVKLLLEMTQSYDRFAIED